MVYVGMCADILHKGHINLINFAKSFGNVTVGLLTDEAVESYKRKPINTFYDRMLVVSSIKGVLNVVPQTTLDYRPNLLKFKPNYVVHGDEVKITTKENEEGKSYSFFACTCEDKDKEFYENVINTEYEEEVFRKYLLTNLVFSLPKLRKKASPFMAGMNFAII